MVKDSKRGNTILLDPDILNFVPYLHLTPQAMVDIESKWKDERPVFDSSFHPEIWSEGINDWINKETEGDVYFPENWIAFLIDIWNFRISYPEEPLYLGDDDIKNAFRLIKINPFLVGMHAYVGCGVLALNTGMTFGNTNSPANFDRPATARSQHARWLWKNEGEDCVYLQAEALRTVELMPQMSDVKYGKANQDSLNQGKFDDEGNRKSPDYRGWVDDHFFVDTEQYFHRTIACSLQAAEDTFGGSHPHQEDIIAGNKYVPQYQETRTLIGFHPNTRTMMVELSPRRRDKITKYIHEEQWLTREWATIREIAIVLGLLQSICDIFLWGQAQLLVLQQLLARQVRKGYNIARRDHRLGRLILQAKVELPASMQYRLKYMKERHMFRFLWRARRRIRISKEIRKTIKKLYTYLKSGRQWECPIGHLIPRDMASETYGDASFFALGGVNHETKTFFLIPYKRELQRKLESGEVHINIMELIALFIGYIMFLGVYEKKHNAYPPTPYLKLWGDNMAANKWFRKFSTNSLIATTALLMFAEYMKFNAVSPCPFHIAGTSNVVADDISRVHEMFTPHLDSSSTYNYPSLIRQV